MNTTPGEKIALVSGGALFIASFLPWYKFERFFISQPLDSDKVNAWEGDGAIWSILAVLTGALMVGLLVAVRFANVKLPALPRGFTLARIHLGLAAAGIVLMAIRIVSHSDDLAYGTFIGIACAVGMITAGIVMNQEERSTHNTAM